jgi:hypothetical protein
MHIINDVTFIHDSEDYIADVEVEILSLSYGEDADGNRGEMYKEIGRFNILNVRDIYGNTIEDYTQMYQNIYEAVKDSHID